ncbi:TPA: BglG family transcription antiterminator [Streptococcus suis]
MLDKKSMLIIDLLISEEEVSLQKAMTSTQLTKKQVYYAVERVNDFLINKNQEKILISQHYVAIPTSSKNFLIDSYLTDRFSSAYIMDSEERLKYIFFKIVHQEQDYLSIAEFLYSMEVSKTTFNADMKRLQEYLLPFEICVEYDRKRGYYLSGKEYQIRNLLMQIILQDFSESANNFFYDYFLKREKVQYVSEINAYLTELLSDYAINFTERRYREFVYTFVLLLPRFNNEVPIAKGSLEFQLSQLKEYELATKLLRKFFGTRCVDNELYIASWILGMSVGDVEENSNDRNQILKLVNEIMERFELYSGIRFVNRKEVSKKLYGHFRSVYYRLLFRIPILNIYTNRIKEQHNDIFFIVSDILKSVLKQQDLIVPDSEIAYLTLHFVVAIGDYGKSRSEKYVAIVVCPNGIGSSALLIQELRQLFTDYIFLGPYDNDSLIGEDLVFDMVFTTVPNIELYTLDKEVFVVNPVMTAEERYNLVKKVYSYFGSQHFRLPKVSDLISIVEKNAQIINRSQLLNDFYNYLLPLGNTEKEDAFSEISLLELLSEKTIQITGNYSSYEDLLAIAAQPLLDNGTITKDYLEAVKQEYRNGSTMMITDSFCMPHTHASAGALGVGMSLVILKEPVGLFDGQKVEFVLMLAAQNDNRHLFAMGQLLRLLGNSKFLEQLKCLKTVEEVVDYLHCCLL